MSTTRLAACILPENETEPAWQKAPVRVCVIDVGTNSIHTVICDVLPSGAFKILTKMKEMVKLGEGSLSNHRLSRDAMDRAIAALKRVRMLAEGWKATEFMAFATSAVREAENGGDFLLEAREAAGIKIRTISGEFEAKLIFKGVGRALQIGRPTLVVDIGGGSTEFVVARGRRLKLATSLKLGAARMSERFVSSDPISKAEIKALRAHYRSQLSGVLESARSQDVKRLVGSSGTMENLALVALTVHDRPLRELFTATFSAKEFKQAAKAIIRSTGSEREALKAIDRKRVDQIVAGAVLVHTLLKDLNIAGIRISPDALREGMLLHFIEENYQRLERLGHFSDLRRRSVYELGYRCQWDEPHVRQVTAIALQLFDATRELHGFGQPERELLEYAALLHDIGYHISRRSHHKHSLYLIDNADLRGFDRRELQLIANIARYHRKAFPSDKHEPFALFEEEDRKIVSRLAAILRLAEGLDESHFQNVVELETQLKRDRLDLRIRTQSDPQIDLWKARRSVDLFESEFSIKVGVSAVEPDPSRDLRRRHGSAAQPGPERWARFPTSAVDKV